MEPTLFAELDQADDGDQVVHGGGKKAAHDGDDVGNVWVDDWDYTCGCHVCSSDCYVLFLAEGRPSETWSEKMLSYRVEIYGVGHNNANLYSNNCNKNRIINSLVR